MAPADVVPNPFPLQLVGCGAVSNSKFVNGTASQTQKLQILSLSSFLRSLFVNCTPPLPHLHAHTQVKSPITKQRLANAVIFPPVPRLSPPPSYAYSQFHANDATSAVIVGRPCCCCCCCCCPSSSLIRALIPVFFSLFFFGPPKDNKLDQHSASGYLLWGCA